MRECLSYIAAKKPKSGCLENVEGFTHSGEFGSGVDFVLQHLRNLGYAADWRLLDLVDHVPCSRRRTDCICACVLVMLEVIHACASLVQFHLACPSYFATAQTIASNCVIVVRASVRG